ncbi:MAG: NGG1p interacting factor NIF3 [Bacterioplanes sp.]|nr:NGG1p interacting factor NIF3 [Bacterioplanes sp.]
MYKLIIFVPEDALEQVKLAVFAAGAGHLGHYSDCCWQVLGQGQFRPRQGANPVLGALDALTCVAEYRLELLCDASCIRDVVSALRQAHPYEEPAFEVLALVAEDNW